MDQLIPAQPEIARSYELRNKDTGRCRFWFWIADRQTWSTELGSEFSAADMTLMWEFPPFTAEPWKNCPSTHCLRRGECASPHECSARALKVQGVGRMSDNTRALLLLLSGEPTDDQMRSLHDYLKGWRP